MKLPSRRWAVVATVGTLAALAAIEPMVAPPIVKGDSFVTAQTGGLLNIEGGECFSDPVYSREAAEVVVRYEPCESGADNQSYGFLRAVDGPWDRAGLADFAWQGCRGTSTGAGRTATAEPSTSIRSCRPSRPGRMATGR
ncbi:hypothetical protein [Plantactinospora veratri]